MNNRDRIIGVRLAPNELAKMNAYLEEKPHLSFSRIVRLALEEFFTKYFSERPITVLNNRSAVKQPMPLFDRKKPGKGKSKKGRKTRRKVA